MKVNLFFGTNFRKNNVGKILPNNGYVVEPKIPKTTEIDVTEIPIITDAAPNIIVTTICLTVGNCLIPQINSPTEHRNVNE